MKSEYHHRFLLRLTEAVRTGWACLLMGTMLLYVPRIETVASVPVLAPVVAILVSGPPLGTVLHNGVSLLAVAVPALASTMVVLQVLKPPISTFAAIACTGVSSCFIAYLTGSPLLGRKMALAQISIVYVTAHYNADLDVVSFPLKMMAPDVIGVAVAIIATIFPIPRLAFLEVRKSAKSAARGASEFFKTLVKAISASDASTFGSMHLHSNVLAKASMDALTDLKQKQVDIWWELRVSGAKHHAHEQFTKVLDCLNLHLTGMEMALDSGYVLGTPVALRRTLEGTLMKVVDQCKSILDFQSVQLPWLSSNSMTRMSRQKLIEEGKETLNLFDINTLSAREQAYYTTTTDTAGRDTHTEDVMQCQSEPWKHHSTKPNVHLVKQSFRGRVSMLFFLFNFRLYLVESINLVSAGREATNEMYQIAGLGPSVADLESTLDGHDINNAPTQASPGERLTENCTKSALEQVFSRQDEPSSVAGCPGEISTENCKKSACGQAFSRQDEPSKDRSKRWSSDRLNRDSRSRRFRHCSSVFNDESQAADQEADHRHRYEDPRAGESGATGTEPSARVSRSSLRRQCSHRNAVAMENIIKKTGGTRSDCGTWKLLRRLAIKPSKNQSKRALKTALSMVLATVFSVLVLQEQPEAFWAPVTVSFIIGNFQGGSWRIANLRLQGTVLGAIYGFLALSASQSYKWAILLLLVPWVIFSSFIRYSPSYGYSGLVAAFTAAILMLGRFQGSVKQFALSRITETFVGILCFVFVETIVFPERAVVLVRQELVSSLISLRDCVGAIVTVYTGPTCIHCRSLAVKEIKQLEQELRASFAKQSTLSKEAALEPDLWFVPFPADVYSKLIAIQGRMLDLLFFMVASLHATTEDCFPMVASEQMETLLRPLRTSLTALQEEILATIDHLQEALQVEIVMEGKFGRLKRWLRCSAGLNTSGDVEQPQNSYPDPKHPLQMLGHRHRSLDGIPINLKSALEEFEHSFENVLEDLISSTKAKGNKQIVSNSVMLSVGSLTFSLHSLLRETVHLEKAVHELLQAENPWSILDFYDTYSVVGGFNDPDMGGGQ